jgi:hypothetical protein
MKAMVDAMPEAGDGAPAEMLRSRSAVGAMGAMGAARLARRVGFFNNT